jgi:hypothetical protein
MVGECFGECFGEWYLLNWMRNQSRRVTMEKLRHLWIQYGTPRNLKVVYILVTLAALAVAGGAPSAGSGTGSY